jgi:XTP/dITP diphosphohydrolase
MLCSCRLISLLIATRNAHKVAEIQTILGSNFCCLPLSNFDGAPEVIEDQATFVGNAKKKSTEIAEWIFTHRSKLDTPSPNFVLADDSGLEVDALNGAPGVYSARFAALDGGSLGNSSTAANNAKLLRLLENVTAERRTARFRCVIAVTSMSVLENAMSAEPAIKKFEGNTELFEGSCEGRIGFEPRGEGGFGYDPLFLPAGHDQTFAQLGEEIKNGLSHRARALGQLKRWLSSPVTGSQKR